jgi:glutamate/tyrosine decarboxylase-like PLP-dependent enzyme
LAEVAPLLFDHSLHDGHPKFLGYIMSSAAPLGALADLLAASVNANVVKWDLSPVASEIESQTIHWLADLIGYEGNCAGLMVSGGNMANFLAFVAARTAKAPWNLRAEGNYGDERRLTVYVSKETHTWVQKAADVCGLGAEGIRWIDTDTEGRMCIDSLRTRLAEDRASGRLPFLVVATAGSVSTGVCQKEDLWLHADGAYGAPAAVLPDAPDDLHALSLADSVAMDPHKWLYCPIEAACVITKHERALQDAFGFYPDYYLFDEEREAGINYYEVGMQNSRGFRALKVWLALRRTGREGYCESIRDDIQLAELLYALADAHEELSAHSINLSIARDSGRWRVVPVQCNCRWQVSAARLYRQLPNVAGRYRGHTGNGRRHRQAAGRGTAGLDPCGHRSDYPEKRITGHRDHRERAECPQRGANVMNLCRRVGDEMAGASGDVGPDQNLCEQQWRGCENEEESCREKPGDALQVIQVHSP